MQVTSLELSKTLSKLSGWKDTDFHYRPAKNSKNEIEYVVQYRMGNYASVNGEVYSAYDLGYLVRKLPDEIKLDGLHYFGDHIVNTFWLEMERDGKGWAFYYSNGGENCFLPQSYPDTPEDAACKLAIELIRQGVLNARD